MQRSLLFLALISAPLMSAALMSAAGRAQTQPATGILQVPPKNAVPENKPTPATNPPAPAPRNPVQQVAPNTLGHSAPGKPPPVVQPPANVHAQKPAPATAPKPPTKPVVAPVAGAKPVGTVAKPADPPPPPVAEKAPAPSIGAVTQQPLPRWASLRTDEVNLRAGPGTRYPIEWLYHRAGLPVQIEREFETWRLVTDYEGVKGWVHSATLQGRRGFAIKGKDRILRKTPADDAAPVATLRPGVVGRIRTCEAGSTWCEVQTGDYKGFLKRDDIWGVFAGEVVK